MALLRQQKSGKVVGGVAEVAEVVVQMGLASEGASAREGVK